MGGEGREVRRGVLGEGERGRVRGIVFAMRVRFLCILYYYKIRNGFNPSEGKKSSSTPANRDML